VTKIGTMRIWNMKHDAIVMTTCSLSYSICTTIETIKLISNSHHHRISMISTTLRIIPIRITASVQGRTSNHSFRTIFTNTDLMKKDDPYATLGIQWGATTTEIKDAFKKKARELHPDVNKTDNPKQALEKFQAAQKAYSKLMDVKGAPHRDDLLEEWSFAVWRNGDLIAQERDDVAGVMRKRPAKPAASNKPGSQWGVASLGHPNGGGNKPRRAEYLGDGVTTGPRTSTVGTGQNKWVKKKEFEPWNPDSVKVKAVSRQMNGSSSNRKS
jgi:hypothetical protein